MPNPNYNAGRQQEYVVRKRMLKAGMLAVLRTAGSHGFADLIGVHRSGRVHFVQVKRVQNNAQAKRLVRHFTQNPPLPKGEYSQILTIYVSESREYIDQVL